MFGFVSLGVSFASLVISCAALYWSRMARIEAAGAVERSRYALESSRKHVGLPYDHKIVHDWELRTQFGFAPQIKDDWTRRKDSDGVADSDDAFEVFSASRCRWRRWTRCGLSSSPSWPINRASCARIA